MSKLDEGIKEAGDALLRGAGYRNNDAMQDLGEGIISKIFSLADNLQRFTGRHGLHEVWLERQSYNLVYYAMTRQACDTEDANPKDGKVATGLITLNHHAGPIRVRQAE